MKLIYLPVLSLALAATAPAADFSPNKMGPLLQKPLPSAVYRLGLDYVQSHDESDQQFIQRGLNLAIGLPAQFEFGLGLLDTQEPRVDHRSKPLGGLAWLRWNMVQSSLFSLAATLQYQPGLSTYESQFQANQDRTSIGVDMGVQPWSWLSSAVYANYSRRLDERFHAVRLGTEAVVGARLSLGTSSYGIYGDGSQRHLNARHSRTGESGHIFAREWQAGLYVGTKTLQFKTFALIPDTQRYLGMPERGFGASFTMLIGSGAEAPVDPRDNPGDALAAIAKAERENEDAEKLTESDIKILETNELDEFQLLEKKMQEKARNQKETPAEKAEREMRQSLEAEKKMAAQKALEDEKAKRDADQAYQQRVQDREDAYLEYKDEVNEEVNRYTLPDQDDLNWNGLTP
ncbi:hypothetical protein [Oligoflexus tunisiensis]|uniref:hypothetical protein n=1 Tax=Oligoflexus tunisiensis TaxID=708132 RepID=UPI00114C854C|nr:hypothetical protein [Oligoflexus tunisiensis]